MTIRIRFHCLSMALLLPALFSGCGNDTTAPVTAEPVPPLTRTYYIAADEVPWDFAPTGMNQITGLPFGDVENTFVQNGPDRVGHVYLKALYREYTDATFGTLKPVAPAWLHLGVMGPLVRAVVGDSVQIVFKNNASRPYTIHMHGLQYVKGSEGAGYNDGSTADGDSVAPGAVYTYHYFVPFRSGPGPMDGSSCMWMYHSHIDEPADTNAGLVGPAIVTLRSMARADGSPVDVDREFVNLFTVFDENASHYIQQNVDTYCGVPASVNLDDEGFHESNLMHSINGYVYGNLPGLTMHRGERVRWYLMGMGTEVDLHTPHWHGATVTIMGMRTDVTELLPMTMKTADMVPDEVGTWLYHCHVNDHIVAGMLALFNVLP